MEENKITVVIVSRETDKEKEKLIERVKESSQCSVDIVFLINNGGVGLTTLYDDMLDKSVNNIIVYMHDDIDFLKDGWGKEILRLFNEHQEYGIIGVAGSAEFNEDAAWWRNKKIYGQVLHRNDGKTWLTAFSPLFNDDLREVCVVDGLFFAVDRTRISKRFDKDFDGFDHYDTSFCLANYVDGKTKIGVTTNIRIAHNSIGKLKDNWYSNREKLNNKYKEYYPILVK